MTKILTTIIFLSITVIGQSQSDTLIDSIKYEIIDRYSNGKVKYVGQFADDCLANKHKRHGYFLTYNKNGVQVNKALYFYDKKHDRKILGLKHGWWGFYGRQTKYFLGAKKIVVITDPCF